MSNPKGYPTAGTRVAPSKGPAGFQAGPAGMAAGIATAMISDYVQQLSTAPAGATGPVEVGNDYPIATPSAAQAAMAAGQMAQALLSAGRKASNVSAGAARLLGRALPALGLMLTLWDAYQIWRLMQAGTKKDLPVPGRWHWPGYKCVGYYRTGCGNPSHHNGPPTAFYEPTGIFGINHTNVTVRSLGSTPTAVGHFQTVKDVPYDGIGPQPQYNSKELWQAIAGQTPGAGRSEAHPRGIDRPAPPWGGGQPKPLMPAAAPTSMPLQNAAVRAAAKAAGTWPEGSSSGNDVRKYPPIAVPGTGPFRPATKWVVQVGPNGTYKSGAQPGQHLMAKAGHNTYETKYRAPSPTQVGGGVPMKLYGKVTESLDVLEIAFQGLDSNLRKYYGRQFTQASIGEKAAMIWQLRADIDWSGVATSLFLNEVADMLSGASGQIKANVAKMVGLPVTTDYHGYVPRSARSETGGSGSTSVRSEERGLSQYPGHYADGSEYDFDRGAYVWPDGSRHRTPW